MNTNIRKLHKYTVIWGIVGMVSAILLTDNTKSFIGLTMTVILWMIMTNIAIHQTFIGKGEWWMAGTVMLSAMLALGFASAGLDRDPVAVVSTMVLFGLLMSGYAWLDVHAEDGQKGERILVKFAYWFFFASALWCIWSSRLEIFQRFRRMMSS